MKKIIPYIFIIYSLIANAQTLIPIWTKQGQPYNNAVQAIAFNNDGTKILSATDCPDSRIRLFETNTSNMTWEHSDSTMECYLGASFSSNGDYFAVMEETALYSLFSNTSSTPNLIGTLNTGLGGARAIALAPDNSKILVGGSNDTLRVYSALTGTLIYELGGHTSSILSVAFSPNGTKFASGDESGKVKVWDATNGNLIGTYTAHSAGVNSIKFTSDNNFILTAGLDGMAHLASVSSLQVIRMYMDMSNMQSIFCADVSNDLSFVVVGTKSGTTIIYDYTSGNIITRITNADFNDVLSVAISSDNNHFAIGTESGSVVLYARDFIQSTKSQNLEINLEVFPNPTKNFLNFNSNQLIKSYRVFDVLGKEVLFKNNLNTSYTSIDITSIPDGTYSIVFLGENNQNSKTFIKN
jgi:WD40 repeat protein